MDLSYHFLIVIVITAIIDRANGICGFPGRPAYGRIIESSPTQVYQEGDVINYVCKPGYYMMGRPSRMCASNGTWTAQLPICDSTLSELGEAVSPSSLNQYPPYYAVDDNPRTCFYSQRTKPRSWNVDLVESRKVLSVAITIPFASSEHVFSIYVSENNNTASNWTRCSSFNGMFATQSQNIICTAGGVVGRFLHIVDDSKQYEYFGLCEVKIFVAKSSYECGQAERPFNAYPIESHHANQVIYRCLPGYKLHGPPERQCQSDGSWSHYQAVCLMVKCPNIHDIPFGRVKMMSPNNNQPIQSSVATFSCDIGYHLIGNSSAICLVNGVWSALPPNCQIVKCEPIDTVQARFGRYRLLNESTNYKSVARLECYDNRDPIGLNYHITCQEDGTWSKPMASCDRQTLVAGEDLMLIHSKASLNGGNAMATILMMSILIILIICIILMMALLFKRKILAVKLITWQEAVDTKTKSEQTRPESGDSFRLGFGRRKCNSFNGNNPRANFSMICPSIKLTPPMASMALAQHIPSIVPLTLNNCQQSPIITIEPEMLTSNQDKDKCQELNCVDDGEQKTTQIDVQSVNSESSSLSAISQNTLKSSPFIIASKSTVNTVSNIHREEKEEKQVVRFESENKGNESEANESMA